MIFKNFQSLSLLVLIGASACSSQVRTVDQTAAVKGAVSNSAPTAAKKHDLEVPPSILPPAIQSSESRAAPTEQIGFTQAEVAAQPDRLKTPTASLSKFLAKSVESKSEKKTEISGVPAETSLRWLKNGNLRYTSKNFRNDGKSQADRVRLLAGQKPHAIILSCSDSRVPPELVFDQALGEVFVIRVAGEAIDSSVVASIEYAVEHLGSHLLVVMGHEYCGAVTAALKTAGSAGSESLDRLIADIKPRVQSIARNPLPADVSVESSENAKRVAADLQLRSVLIKEKVQTGVLRIVPALYRMSNGVVDFL